MTVRSTQLGRFTSGTATSATIFTVPAGWRAIVKNVLMDNFTAAAAEMAVWLTSTVDGSQLVMFRQSVDVNGTAAWAGWAVMNPGDYLNVDGGAAGTRFWASGTLLLLTGAEPPVATTLPLPPGPRPPFAPG